MTQFSRGKPIMTSASQITVDGLAPGRHLFTLVVRDTADNLSRPATAEVIVLEGRLPPNQITLKDDGVVRPDHRPPPVRPT